MSISFEALTSYEKGAGLPAHLHLKVQKFRVLAHTLKVAT